MLEHDVFPRQFCLYSCVERRYFGTLHSRALTCEDEVLVERLRQRPSWRQPHVLDDQSEYVSQFPP
jgi:hypothetical protein